MLAAQLSCGGAAQMKRPNELRLIEFSKSFKGPWCNLQCEVQQLRHTFCANMGQ
jgi:hypothetical protein